jgi:hypothetical protein
VPKPLAVVPELETELDSLYALSPAEFTPARNDLARRLKQAGQDEAAARIKSLRKPTAPLWAVNQLARLNPKGIEGLLSAGDQLRKAQEEALRGGESTALRKATADERQILRELTQQGDELLRESGHGTAGDRIAATLRTAALAPDQQELLRQGRLSEELESSGFGALAGMEIPQAATKAKAPSAAAQRRREEQLQKLREQAAKLRREAAQAARDEKDAVAALARARKQAARAEEAAARAEALVDERTVTEE